MVTHINGVSYVSLEQAIALVKNSASSIFTKSDVIELLDRIDDTPNVSELRRIRDQIEDVLKYVGNDFIDTHDLKYEINGDIVNVKNFTLNLKGIMEELDDSVFDKLP